IARAMTAAAIWFSTSLVAHFIALIILAGGAVGGLIVDKIFWKRVFTAPAEAVTLAPALIAASKAAPMGAGLLLLTGLSILGSVHFSYWGTTWLPVKLILFVFLALNGGLVGGRTVRRVAALLPQRLAAEGAAATRIDDELRRLEQRLRIFHITEN